MATRIVVCPECGVPVPYGRLSCPECGSLLASVVGVSRRLTPIAVAEVPLAQPAYAPPRPPFPLPAAPLPLPAVHASPPPVMPVPAVAPAPAPARSAAPAPRPASGPPRSTQPRRIPAPASPPPTTQTAGASTLADVLAAAPAVAVPASTPAAPAPPTLRTPNRRRPTRIEDPSQRSVLEVEKAAPVEKGPSDEPLPLGRWDLAAALPSAAETETPTPPAMPAPTAPQISPDAPPATAPARPASRPPRLSPAYAASVSAPKPPPLTTSAPLRSRLPLTPPPLTPPPLTPPPPLAAAATEPASHGSGGPAWPTNAAVPAVTPRRAADRTRTAPKANGQPTNGAAGMAMPAPAGVGPPVPIWPPEPAGEPLAPSAVFAGAPDVDELLGATPTTSMSSTLAAESPRPPSLVAPARASRPRLPGLANLHVDLPDSLADWLIAAGSSAALVGFLLPWSDAVVGAKSFGGYTDSWGLAVPSHFLVVLLLGAVLTLSVIPNPVPSWIRTGVLGALVGGLLLGLAWPYLISGFGASLGIFAEAIGALVLVAGSVTERRTARHGDPADSV